jgi:hypothetical protein
MSCLPCREPGCAQYCDTQHRSRNECSLCNLIRHPQRSRLAGNGKQIRQEESAIACNSDAEHLRSNRRYCNARDPVRPPANFEIRSEPGNRPDVIYHGTQWHRVQCGPDCQSQRLEMDRADPGSEVQDRRIPQSANRNKRRQGRYRKCDQDQAGEATGCAVRPLQSAALLPSRFPYVR